ncbi:MFS transporter [Actinomadura rudentiformis]|uniref:MFS transporter n=1 Tax=Actinomadura rudentiformis TaxID=359158 RepID=A0A6H9YVP3_9ACTN|nr:MFS transporter [Actinomadura rudentiformis]KAB2350047.1 MFS transporter [Actinomadura rudentiformis]
MFAPALVPAEQRGRALATVGAGMAVATAVGVPLGTLIGGAFGWRATFLALAALGVTVLWSAGAFTVLTYIGPILDEVGGVRGEALSLWLLVFGFAAVAGNALGGRATDHRPTLWLAVACTAGLAVAPTAGLQRGGVVGEQVLVGGGWRGGAGAPLSRLDSSTGMGWRPSCMRLV